MPNADLGANEFLFTGDRTQITLPGHLNPEVAEALGESRQILCNLQAGSHEEEVYGGDPPPSIRGDLVRSRSSSSWSVADREGLGRLDMGSQSTPTSTPTDAAPGQPPLATLVARAPDLVRRMLAAAAQEAASETDPHLPERRCTGIIATYCEHLAAMEMTVYSVARRRLPGGEQAAVVEALAHDAELVTREMEERIGGDRFAAAPRSKP